MRNSLVLILALSFFPSVAGADNGPVECLLNSLFNSDCDSDGLDNDWETGCENGRPNPGCEDTDDDRIRDFPEVNGGSAPDTDSDGWIDACDSDSDGDGIPDLTESGCASLCNSPVDTDGDGVADYRDRDSDNDGRPDAVELTGDVDGDGLPNWRDGEDRDGPQGDLDGDRILNPADNCLSAANADQRDSDGDGAGDACDRDDDGDGRDDAVDNCPLMSNASQNDYESDGIGDVCDPDDDDDGVNDGPDNCDLVPNSGQEDADRDGFGDACDLVGDPDSDVDGVGDAIDNCPSDANSDQADLDGDRSGDACDPDEDGDGVDDDADLCPRVPNNDQADLDRDGQGDLCDDDDDDDRILDSDDNCPAIANQTQDDADGDRLGDACDADDDADGIEDARDNCRGDSNPEQADQDGDGMGDLCDLVDLEEEGVSDGADTCSSTVSAGQADLDGDRIGDACDEDADGDGFLDATGDNCVGMSNDQRDSDGDGAGDLCDADADGDGWLNERETLVGTDPLNGASVPSAQGGGCRSTRGSADLGLLIALALVLGTRRRFYRSALLSIALFDSGEASAQVDAQLLRPAPLAHGGIAVESSSVLPAFAFQTAVWGGHAGNPVELVDEEGHRLTGVIDGLSTVDLRLTLGLPAGFEVSTLLPVQVMTGEGPAALSGAGVGDWSVSAKWLAVSRDRFPVFGVGLSAKAELFLPTGDSDRLGGGSGIGAALSIALDRGLGPVLFAANLGGRFRDRVQRWQGASIGQQLTYGAVVDWEIVDDLHATAELYGALGFGGEGASPVEALGSVGYRIGPVLFAAGGGAGLAEAIGVPTWRAFGAIGLSIEPAKDTAADADGDGVVDIADPCLELAEDRDGFQDNDGCPDPDNDEDGVVDAKDECVNSSEDADGFEDGDGCSENDDDGDAIVDVKDACPRAAESVNGFQDDDGCPDVSPTYRFAVGERLVFNDIQFQTNSYQLLDESYPVLDAIVKSLQEQPAVRIRIEGHTDGQGRPRTNLLLSEQRALAVLNYLVSAGVDSKRIAHAGYGDTRPIAGNDTDENRAQNRRVELVTLEASR